MAINKRSTASAAPQAASRSQSNLDWNVPKHPLTPSSEYAFMRSFSMLCARMVTDFSGPAGGGVAPVARPNSVLIQYDQKQVAMIIRVRAFYEPGFAQQAGVSTEDLEQMIEGNLAPSPSVLSVLKFEEDCPGVYLWHMPIGHEASISNRAPKPSTPQTPRRDYAFMCTMPQVPQGGSFGPVGGGVQ